MATSGSTDFTETRDQIITNALSLLGVVAANETVQTADITYCSSMLNSMVKSWIGMGIHLFTEEEGTLFFVNGQYQYQLQAGDTTHASSGTNTVETTLSTAVSSGTSIVLNLPTINGGTIADDDIIGIELNDNTIQWTVVSGTPVTTSSTITVTLDDAITGAASASNQVFSYTQQCPRVLSIQTARVRDENSFDRRIKVIPRADYMLIPQKTLSGTPVILYYSPQLSEGTVYLWPAPNDVGQRLEFTYLRTIEDFDSAGDTPDFPQEWIEAIVYNLAVRVAPAYGVALSSGGINGNTDLLRQAAQYLEDMKAWDAEQPYISIVPGYRFDGGHGS